MQGNNRSQIALFPVSLEEAIDQENEVRIIDLFVDSLQLEKFGFKVQFVENGRPAYHPSDLLKLFIYGYLNKIRSSRDLEKECKRNIEVMWLLNSLKPDHNTISNFRRDNPMGNKQTTNGTWYKKDRNKDSVRVQHYKTKACKHCPALNQCTKNTKGRGRVIERTEFAQYYETNKKNVTEKELLYKRRQAIVEHPFGIIKRQWGFYYISTKKRMNRASVDVGSIFLAFNLRCFFNNCGSLFSLKTI